MTLKEYQQFAAQGILPATLEREPIVGFALGLAGEAGEVVDDIKKRYYHGRTIDENHTLEELGDVMWYVANIATQMGASLEDIMVNNVEKLTKRYPQMYHKTVSVVCKCPKCDSTDISIVKNGPHFQAKCAQCGAHIKFIAVKDIPKEIYDEQDNLPWN